MIREYAHPDDPVSFQGVVAEREDGVGEIRSVTVGEGGAGDGCAQSSLGTAMAVLQGGSDFGDLSPSPDDNSSEDYISSAPGSEHVGKKRRDLGLANDGRAWEAHSHGAMDCIGILEERLRAFVRMEEEVVVMKERLRGIEELEEKMVVLMEVEGEAVDLRRQMETMQVEDAISKVAQKTRDLAEQNNVILAEKVLYPFSCPRVSSSSFVECVC